jgi:hypothetical protein
MPYAIRSAASADDSPSGTEFADLLEEEEDAVGGLRHRFAPASSMSTTTTSGALARSGRTQLGHRPPKESVSQRGL